MDTLDAAILRELAYPASVQWNVRESYSAVAAAVGVDEQTVRSRLRRLEEADILRGWDLLVNPTLLGRSFVRINAEVARGADKHEAIERLGLLDGVYWVFDDWGQALGVAAYLDDGEATERFVRLVASITQEPAWRVPMRRAPAAAEPDGKDWRIIQQLRRQPRAAYDELAAALGLSAKTVRRRVERLIDGRAILLTLDLAFENFAGLIPVEVHVVHGDPARRPETDAYLRALPNRLFWNDTERASQVGCAPPTMAGVVAIRDHLAAARHLEQVRVEVIARRVAFKAWIDGQIARRAGSPPVSPPVASAG